MRQSSIATMRWRGMRIKLGLLLLICACAILLSLEALDSATTTTTVQATAVRIQLPAGHKEVKAAEGRASETEEPEWRSLPVKTDNSKWLAADSDKLPKAAAKDIPDLLPSEGAADRMPAAEAATAIKESYLSLCEERSDINEHLPTLHDLAAEGGSAAELGVRSMVSTWALLQGLVDNGKEEKRLLSVDLEPVPGVQEVLDMAAAAKVDHRFRQRSSLDVELEQPVDLLLIDTFHVYGQLKRELAKHAGKVRRYIALHDTVVDGELGEYVRMQKWGYDWEKRMYKAWWAWSGLSEAEISRGLQPAIDEFLAGHKGEWRLLRQDTNNNGLTVLVRMSGGPS